MQAGQWYEDVEWKQEYYHIKFSLKGLKILHQEKRKAKTVVVLSILILHYNMYYFHFTLQEPC